MEKMDVNHGSKGRGRPPLPLEDRADYARTKLTLRLKDENCQYIFDLKERAVIFTYAQFFDFLIEGFRQQQQK